MKKNKYVVYFGNEEIKLSKNAYAEFVKWREHQIAKELEKKLKNINKEKPEKGTLDA